MKYNEKAYLEHMAIYVKDISWSIKFFEEVFGMTIRKMDGPSEAPVQVWLHGGVQLIAAPDFDLPEGRAAHLGIWAENMSAALEAAYERGAEELPKGHNWIKLPDGLCIEVMQAEGNAVQDYWSIRSIES